MSLTNTINSALPEIKEVGRALAGVEKSMEQQLRATNNNSPVGLQSQDMDDYARRLNRIGESLITLARKVSVSIIIAAAMFAMMAYLTTVPASAATQPMESFNSTHCSAAFEADDWGSVLVYCNALAQDHSVDAANEVGDSHVLDIMLEALSLGKCALAYGQMGDSTNHSAMQQEALHLLNSASNQTTDSHILDLISRGIDVIVKM